MNFKPSKRVDLDKLFDARLSNKISDKLFATWYQAISIRICSDLEQLDKNIPLSNEANSTFPRSNILDLVEPVCRGYFYSTKARARKNNIEKLAKTLVNISLHLMEDKSPGALKMLSRKLNSVTSLYRKLNSGVAKQTARHINSVTGLKQRDVPQYIYKHIQELGAANSEREKISASGKLIIRLKYHIWYYQDLSSGLHEGYWFLVRTVGVDKARLVVYSLLAAIEKNKFPTSKNAKTWHNRAKNIKYTPRKKIKDDWLKEPSAVAIKTFSVATPTKLDS